MRCCEQYAYVPLSALLHDPYAPGIACSYVQARYGVPCDGAVCVADALLPGTTHVCLDDMDHFGPGWRLFPASDPYDPARLCLALTRLALERSASQLPEQC